MKARRGLSVARVVIANLLLLVLSIDTVRHGSDAVQSQNRLALERVSSGMCCAGSYYGNVSPDASAIVFENHSYHSGRTRSDVYVSADMKKPKQISPQDSNGDWEGSSYVRGASPVSYNGNLIVFSATSNEDSSEPSSTRRVYLYKAESDSAYPLPTSDQHDTILSSGCLASISANGELVVFLGEFVDDSVPENGGTFLFMWRVGDDVVSRSVQVSEDAVCELGSGSWAPDVDAQGHRVVLVSSALGSTSNSETEAQGIFVISPGIGIVERVSLSPEGDSASGESDWPSISHDGNNIAFRSTAANIDPQASGEIANVYVVDMRSRTSTIVTAIHGKEADADSDMPVISGDGKFVFFSTASTSLFYMRWWERLDQKHIARYDVRNSAIERIIVNHQQVLGDPLAPASAEYKVSSSVEGDTLVFDSATELMGDDNFRADVWLFDTRTLLGVENRLVAGVEHGSLRRISVSSTGMQSQLSLNSGIPVISDGGEFVTFISQDNHLAARRIDRLFDALYSWSVATGDLAYAGEIQIPFESGAPPPVGMLSADEGLMAMSGSTAAAGGLVLSDWRKGVDSVDVCELKGYLEPNRRCVWPRFSSQGTTLVFHSESDLGGTVTDGGLSNVYAYDIESKSTRTLSKPQVLGRAEGHSWYADVDASGRTVVFSSESSSLVESDSNGVSDVFMYDLERDVIRRISMSVRGDETDGPSVSATISGNGKFAAFSSAANNLVSGNTGESGWSVYVVNLETGEIDKADANLQSSDNTVHSGSPSLSHTGRYLAFVAGIVGSAPGENGVEQVYLWDQVRDETLLVSTSVNGMGGNRSSGAPDVEVREGQPIVAFMTDATDIVASDTNFASDVYVYVKDPSTLPPLPVPHRTQTPRATDLPTPSMTPTGHSLVEKVLLPITLHGVED